MNLALVALVGVLSHVIRGTVVDSTHQPVEGAVVTTGLATEHGLTGKDGRFEIVTARSDTVTLTIRAVGFSPLSRLVQLGAADTTEVQITLARVVQKLPSLEVKAEEPVYTSAKMVAFEERRKAGIGRFFTREMLAEREHSVLTSLIRMTPGLSLIRRPEECGGGFAVTSGRGHGMIEWRDWMRCEGGPGAKPFPVACYLAIYLDGVRLYAPGQREPPDIDPIVSLEGIEIYRGPSETPTMFQTTGNSCGAILLWARTGER
jgi:hypothetical protein